MDDDLPEQAVLLADRGYASDKVRETIAARNVVPVIPMRKSPKLRVAVGRTLYRQRNLVERRFNKLKNARRVATLSTSLRPDVISAVTLVFRPTSTGTTLEVPLAASYILTV